MYRCKECGEEFHVPEVILSGFEHEFGFHPESLPVCPSCGAEDLQEVPESCPACGLYHKAAGEILCAHCRAQLFAAFQTFAGALSAEAKEQLDDWMDGESYSDVEEWRKEDFV